MPRSRSIPIQSERVRRRSPLARTLPASWMAPPARSRCSVSVVLPASGWEMMAKVRRRAISAAGSVIPGLSWAGFRRVVRVYRVSIALGGTSRSVVIRLRGIVARSPAAWHRLLTDPRRRVRWPNDPAYYENVPAESRPNRRRFASTASGRRATASPGCPTARHSMCRSRCPAKPSAPGRCNRAATAGTPSPEAIAGRRARRGSSRPAAISAAAAAACCNTGATPSTEPGKPAWCPTRCARRASRRPIRCRSSPACRASAAASTSRFAAPAGRIVLGLHEQRSAEVVDVTDCLVLHPGADGADGAVAHAAAGAESGAAGRLRSSSTCWTPAPTCCCAPTRR